MKNNWKSRSLTNKAINTILSNLSNASRFQAPAQMTSQSASSSRSSTKRKFTNDSLCEDNNALGGQSMTHDASLGLSDDENDHYGWGSTLARAAAARFAKKAKTTTTTNTAARKKASINDGKLEYFQTMPLDVLFEIASHLDPITLLHMSRVSKQFRNIFMTKSSRSLWISARRNIALPDLQADDLSEPAYASLVFEKSCMVCGKGKAQIVELVLRVRYCKNCQKQTLCKERDFRILNLHPQTLLCLPSTRMSHTNRYCATTQHFFQPEVLAVNRKLTALQQAVNMERKANSSSTSGSTSSSALTNLNDFVNAKKRALPNRTIDANTIHKWENSSAMDRQRVADGAKQERRAAIDFWRHSSLVDQPKALTDPIWSRIGPTLIADAAQNKSRRLQQEARDRQRNRLRMIQPLHKQMFDAQPNDLSKSLFPGPTEFETFASVTPFWEPDQVEEYTIDAQAWATATPRILSEAAVWRRNTMRAQGFVIATARNGDNTTLPESVVAKLKTNSGDPSVKINFDSAEFSAIVAPFSASVLCTKCLSLHSYAQLCEHFFQKHSNERLPLIGPYPSTFISSSWIAEIQRTIALVGLDDTTASKSNLLSVGHVFDCSGCMSRGHGYYGAPQPIKQTELNWTELHHRASYSTDWSGQRPTIRLSASATALSSESAAAAMTHDGPVKSVAGSSAS